MKMNKYLAVLVALISAAESAKILGIFMSPSHSHQVVYQPIWRELSLRGHDVTVFTPNPINDPTLTNLTEMDMGFSYDIWKNYSKSNFKKESKFEETRNLFKGLSAVYNAQMSSPQMQKLLANAHQEKFDLFLVEYFYPSMYPFKDVLDCPMIGITSLPLTVGGVSSLGMVKHPVLDPDFLLPFATDLSFKERVMSVITYALVQVNIALKVGPVLNAEAAKYFGSKTKDVLSYLKEISLVLGNYNYVTHNVRPNVPAFVEISGIHIQPEKPLPKDLKQFLDESDEGVVYFSLGSNVKSSLLPPEKLDAILSAFTEIKYKVLFKFEADGVHNASSMPENVEIRKWIPQQDVLRHPNVKLFVTQGGLQSIDEALSAKVPLLFIPFFGDQHFNAHKMVKSGAGLSIDFNDLTKEELVEKINKIIQDPEYERTVNELGSTAFDQQVPPLEKAVWWIEYVLRHNGAKHLQYKGVDLPAYQFYLLDVFCFLGAVFVFVLFAFYKIAKTLIVGFRFLNRNRKSDDSLKKSQ